MNEQKFDIWGIIEIMGHTKLAGRISEASIGGIPMVRVDVPKIKDVQGFTRYYGKDSIFSIMPCEERMARLAAEHIQEPPIAAVHIPQARQLPAADDGHMGPWLCNCGNSQEDDCHCDKCGKEPPWGCDCSDCNERHCFDDEEAE